MYVEAIKIKRKLFGHVAQGNLLLNKMLFNSRINNTKSAFYSANQEHKNFTFDVDKWSAARGVQLRKTL